MLSGLCFVIAWPAIGNIYMAIFIAFFPLLWVESQLSNRNKNQGVYVFLHANVVFLLFNLGTTWWIYFASDWGSVMAILCNSLFMAIVFWLFHLTKRFLGNKVGYISLVIYWLAFEYLHLNWELSWPWLTLGNVFANDVEYVQWYEYTGILGGSLYILLINLLIFHTILYFKKNKALKFTYFLIIPLILLCTKITRWINTEVNMEKENRLNAVIIQPNIDPYYDKFQGMSESDQIDLMVELSKSKVDANTDVLILPETAFPQPFWEHELEFMYGTEEFRKLIADNPQLRVITGILCSKMYTEQDELSATAKKLPDYGWYDNYNAAMQLDSGKVISLHRKSKLVLGAEKIPFVKQIPWMKKLSISLGGTTGRYGTQDHPSIFFDQNKKNGIAPIICYESVYGEYVNEYAAGGASLYAIITNDGWWDNTPGYKQHLAYARLRAIEGRRSIIRSANTGISAIIDAKGKIVTESKWWEEAVIQGEVYLNEEQTFYIKHGDYLGRIAAFLAPLLLLYALVNKFRSSKSAIN